MALSSSAAITALSNGSFETFTGSSTTYQYGDVTGGWTYSGTPGRASLLAPYDDGIATNPLTPYGSTWLLVDSRSDPETITQSLGTIVGGQGITISALIGSVTNESLADFEIGLYRSNTIGGGTADTLLHALTLADVTDPGLGGTYAATSAGYTFVSEDVGKDLFILIRSTDPDTGASVEQTLIDNVNVNVNVAAVPEPSSAALLGLGSLTFILRRRR
ncbi:PEP-CTERM sorting domain-containing protein [Rubritalea marina]|uniref:PEP-CTERM sorting domain-containing protein n=1 Tax=Rubritalea marina TaxID=361055 RepID=UPI000362DDFF|nr:PEP-CTERM sorting domain-containing protein [Rubritalea marina]